jgi:signal transduction histidine kinase
MMTESERVPHSALRSLARHPRLVDVAITIFAVVLPTVAFAVHGPHGRNRLQVADAVSVVVFVPLVLLRRHWPVTTMAVGAFSAAVITLVSAERTVALPAAFVLLFTVASRTNRNTTLRVGGFAATVLFLSAAAQLDGGWFRPDSFAVLAWSGLALAAGDAVRSRREYIAAVEERARRAEETRETEARRRVAEERMRIARELHDVVAHHMAVVNVQAGVASHLLRTQPDQAEAALATVRNAGRSVLAELSGVLNVLRSTDDDAPAALPLPTLAQLDELLASFDDAGLRVEYRTTGPRPELSDTLQLVVYRVIEEALTNAQKYGQGHALVHVARTPSRVDVHIENRIDGALVVENEHRGSAGGHGLLGMRERVAAVNGTVEISAGSGECFTVDAHLPIQHDDQPTGPPA